MSELPLDGQIMTPASSPAGAASGVFALASLAVVGAVLIAGLGASAAWGRGRLLGRRDRSGRGGPRWRPAGAGSAQARRPIAGGMSVATEALGGAFFLAVPGAIFALGHDGLCYALGLGAGGLLMQLVTAPRFARSGASSLPNLMAQRFPGRAVGLLSLSIITASMVGMLVAGLMAAGLVGMRLLGVDFATATVAAPPCAMLACFIVRGAGAGSTVNGLLYPLLLVALLAPLVILSAQWYGLPVPQLAFANSIWQLQGIEENLLEQELADPSFMKPMLTAFLSLSPINFAGITLALAAGIAVLPSLLLPPLAATSARQARHIAFWALGFVVLLLTLGPAVASYARQSIAGLIADRTALAELPAWIFAYGKLGLVQVCGQAAISAAQIAQACAALPDAAASLRLQDVVVDPDVVTLALPEIAGLDGALMGSIAVAVLATVLVTAHAPLSVIVRALGVGVEGAASESQRGNAAHLLAWHTPCLLCGRGGRDRRQCHARSVAPGRHCRCCDMGRRHRGCRPLSSGHGGAVGFPRANSAGAAAGHDRRRRRAGALSRGAALLPRAVLRGDRCIVERGGERAGILQRIEGCLARGRPRRRQGCSLGGA
ncbi:MAG: hypothetical protein WDN31_14285 [Hyphomicrobium sp.]